MAGRDVKLHHGDKANMHWDEEDTSAQMHHRGGRHLLEQMLGYGWVSSEPATIHL